MPPDHADHFVDLAKMVPSCRHPGDATAMVPKSLKFLTRPPYFSGRRGEALQKIDT